MVFMKLQYAIFDMDGLLFDSERVYLNGYNDLAPKYGITPDYKLFLKTVGTAYERSKAAFLEVYPNLDYDAMRDELRVYMRHAMESALIPLKPGVHNILSALKNNGVKVALATSTRRPLTTFMLKTADIADYFDNTVCGDEVAEGLLWVADELERLLPSLQAAVAPLATTFAYVGRMYVIGRGVELGTAREVALKLTETCRVAAEPLTSTDLSHGPIAAVDALFPVWTIASRDECLPALIAAAGLAKQAGATLVACGSAANEVAEAPFRLPVPEAPLPVLSPLLSVVPGQLFAAALARAKGLDPDHPAGLSKVTLAQ
jgi:phosphoglycolate phosphatase-like HAD superfamily hydrolase